MTICGHEVVCCTRTFTDNLRLSPLSSRPSSLLHREACRYHCPLVFGLPVLIFLLYSINFFFARIVGVGVWLLDRFGRVNTCLTLFDIGKHGAGMLIGCKISFISLFKIVLIDSVINVQYLFFWIHISIFTSPNVISCTIVLIFNATTNKYTYKLTSFRNICHYYVACLFSSWIIFCAYCISIAYVNNAQYSVEAHKMCCAFINNQ